MNFGIRLFFLIFASTNNPYIYDRTTVTAKDRVAYVCRQGNHRYRSAAGGQKYAFKDDTCVKETAVITPDNWMEWVVWCVLWKSFSLPLALDLILVLLSVGLDLKIMCIFVIRYKSHLLPIEVKTGNNSKLRSLHQFMEESRENIALRLWNGPLSSDVITRTDGRAFTLYNIPLYYAGHLDNWLNSLTP